ncbi:GTPase Era [Marinivivus vitaminiproducens]|uniref:GTPase Era n=1 Tax=Marinivivus vitaminiproducens TaxID=3035935 RepID=UPI0027AA8A7F|nr:GTPase Era [Geminicoccaceae bacterium SCSIO 64248]
MSDPAAAGSRCGYVALVGAPNVGKSTLLNDLVGTKVSIVSPKVQTTRRRVLGITVKDEAQLVFVDLPGIFAPERPLERAMVQAAWQGAEEADIAVLVVDAERGIDKNTRRVLDGMTKLSRPCLLAINKLDKVAATTVLPLIQELNAIRPFEDTFLVSALKGDGTKDLLQALFARLPDGPWLFPADQLSDLSDRQMAAELTREKIFHKLHQEVPYSITVETEAWAEGEGDVRIDQTIYVMRDSQKAIVLGKGGRQIKEIGQLARAELETLLGKRVHLFLFVKVRENWTDDPERYRELGLDFPG